MQTFKEDLVVKSVGAFKWQLVDAFYFYFDENKKEEGVIVPECFITDFASVPRALWAIFPPIGLYSKAAVMHDYLYQNGENFGYDRRFCDKMLLEAMRALDVFLLTRYCMYIGVRLFGWKYFLKKHECL